ncbi:MAG: hypothetical protein APF76_16090 [Desulfitibacter sp. BRH_c19]|nr:MAG: hypothetical protein APF76_16090 [Desulfitibacter sp. BRH_c19]
MDRDIIINKVQVIERCIARIHEEYNNNSKNLENYTKQDSIILNIQRACEASIDLAMHVVSEKKLGLPQSSREVFDLLCKDKLIDESLADRLKAMVGFRNIAVHDYQTLNLEVIEKIIDNNLDDLKVFTKKLINKGTGN